MPNTKTLSVVEASVAYRVLVGIARVADANYRTGHEDEARAMFQIIGSIEYQVFGGQHDAASPLADPKYQHCNGCGHIHDEPGFCGHVAAKVTGYMTDTVCTCQGVL